MHGTLELATDVWERCGRGVWYQLELPINIKASPFLYCWLYRSALLRGVQRSQHLCS